MDQDAHMKRIIENLSSDLSNLSSESKRKFASVKEASEGCLLKLRHISNQKTNLYKTMCEASPDIIRPLTLGCETKQPKIIQICLTSVQKVIEAKILNQNSASMLINTLWLLTDSGLEELKVLQTIILLVTTTDIVKHQLLARTLTIGLRIAASKDQILMNTATAMLSQMITKVFERVVTENKQSAPVNQGAKKIDFDQLKILSKEPPSWMNESAKDAYMLLQDIYLLLNSDQSLWLININEINKSFGLDILKSILVRYSEIFFSKPEMSFILKERICPLLIKLFSPSTKAKPKANSNANSPTSSSQTPAQSGQHDQKNFVIVSRLIRIVYVLVKNYFDLLITESEIFLSLLTKLLENERPLWQKALSIEVLHKISTETSLIEQLVLNYDMKQQTHGEKLFHMIISSICQLIQSLFLSSSPNQQMATTTSSGSSSSNSQQFSYQISSAQPSFIYKDATLQLLYPYTSGQVKSLYLEGSDRADIPCFPDGYLLSIGFSTLQEMCKSIQSLIEQHLNALLHSSNGIPLKRISLEPGLHLKFCTELMSSSAASLLTVYNLLLDTSLDETITEHVLKSIKLLVHLAAVLNMNCERDWFVTCMCKSALPHNYIGHVLDVQLLSKAVVGASSYRSEQADKQCQIVAVGAPLAQNAPAQLYITAKNLLTIKSLLNMCNLYAELLGSSWYIVLNTLEHLTWTLALKPVSGSSGALKHLSTVHTSDNSMIFTAVQTDIAFICNLLSKLFESTRLISDHALDDVINSLLRLSIERFDLAYVKTEPCLFAISKLYETVISNLSRLDLFWDKVTAHFLSGCKHSNVKYREWCVDSVCNLIRATFNYKYTSSTSESDKIERDAVLRPLHQLSTIAYNDVRQKQIECTLSLLRLMGQHLDESWPVCLSIVGAIQKEHTDILVRSAFQCLQLVVTDFLSMINAHYLSLVVNVVAKFGSQEQDLNISLTAIVLLWNISDYMFQKSDELSKHLANTQLTQTQSLESIWMVLFSRLGQLCVDPRPAVRKSACQTLFCTISSHGTVLNVDLHWKDLIWTVLFPLLEQVRHFTNTASRERDKMANHPNFLMHHSRDTAEKQWAETSVLTLSGVSRVFNSKCSMLIKLSDEEFHKMWTFLLNIIENLALNRNSEISISALRSFHELLGSQNYFSSASSFGQSSASSAQSVAAAAAAASLVLPNGASEKSDSSTNIAAKSLDISQWLFAWKTWLNIGNSLTSSISNSDYWPPPGQTFLTCYIDLMFVMVDKLAPVSKFSNKDFENFSQILDKMLNVPVLSSDYSTFILMQTDSNLTPLQNSALNTLKNLIKLFKTNDQNFQNVFLPLIFQRLLSFVLFACYKNNNTERATKPNEIVNVNYVPFGERALVMLTNLYDETANNDCVIENCILKSIIQTLYVPLSLKYSCPNSTTWKLSIECLFKILKKALPITFKRSKSFETMWLDLANTFEDFLFSKNVSLNDLPLETIQKDELIDCQVIDLIGNEILTHAGQIPQQFVQRILSILNRGSLYSNTFENFLDLDSSRKNREEFSKSCFETLLRFSFSNTNESAQDGNLTKMALLSMLSRCKEIVERYSHDERLNGNIPLSKARTNEMIGALKALSTLVSALNKTQKNSIQPVIWDQLKEMYPSLVDSTRSPSNQICAALREVLHKYIIFFKFP